MESKIKKNPSYPCCCLQIDFNHGGGSDFVFFIGALRFSFARFVRLFLNMSFFLSSYMGTVKSVVVCRSRHCQTQFISLRLVKNLVLKCRDLECCTLECGECVFLSYIILFVCDFRSC